jgi:dihydrofolate reductase
MPNARKLVLQMQVSVDGFIGRRDSGAAWQLWDWCDDCPWDGDLIRQFNAFFETVDCILLSRPMAAGYAAHWAGIARRLGDRPEFAFASRICNTRKIAFSQVRAGLLEAPEVEVADRPLKDFVEALRRGPGGTIVAFGGEAFASSLVAENLVDEYQFYVNPAALGAGRRIFDPARGVTRLELIDASSYRCGIIVQRYQPFERQDPS